MYFMDPVYEEDLVKQNEARQRKFQNLKSNIINYEQIIKSKRSKNL